MRLKELSNGLGKFTVNGLTFVVSAGSEESFDVTVYDTGMLQVGAFILTDIDNDGNMEYHNSDKYPRTLERLRKSGDSDIVVRKLKDIIKS